jgi:hypothetical protein
LRNCFDKVWEKACRDAKIGVTFFKISIQPNALVAQWIEQRIPKATRAKIKANEIL